MQLALQQPVAMGTSLSPITSRQGDGACAVAAAVAAVYR